MCVCRMGCGFGLKDVDAWSVTNIWLDLDVDGDLDLHGFAVFSGTP